MRRFEQSFWLVHAGPFVNRNLLLDRSDFFFLLVDVVDKVLNAGVQ
jgi:hypothetical protein